MECGPESIESGRENMDSELLSIVFLAKCIESMAQCTEFGVECIESAVECIVFGPDTMHFPWE